MIKFGKEIKRGKTKIIYESNLRTLNIVDNTDFVTKNDDASQTITIKNKGAYVNIITSTLFRLLKEAGIPVSFERVLSETAFLSRIVFMLPLEIVVRRYVPKESSFVKRNPGFEKEGLIAYRFHDLVFEVYLKTTNGVAKNRKGNDIGPMIKDCLKIDKNVPVEDPIILDPFYPMWDLRHPKIPSTNPDSNLFCQISRGNILPDFISIEKIKDISIKAFLILEAFFNKIKYHLIDIKLEMAFDQNGNLVVADSIDPDCFRAKGFDWEEEISKQIFRDNASVEEISQMYKKVASLVKDFTLPKQTILVWRESEKDDISKIPEFIGIEKQVINTFACDSDTIALDKLQRFQSYFPDKGVVIAIVDSSKNFCKKLLRLNNGWPIIFVESVNKNCANNVSNNLVDTPPPIKTFESGSLLCATNFAISTLAKDNPIAYMYHELEVEKVENFIE